LKKPEHNCFAKIIMGKQFKVGCRIQPEMAPLDVIFQNMMPARPETRI
jgi:hypothetical protein